MTDLRTAAQQALEDLKDLHANHNITYAGTISRLEAALAQQQANQTWVCPDSPEHRYKKPGHCEDCGKVLVLAQGCDHCNHPLYAATRCRVCGRVTEQAEPVQEPPQRKPLTQEQLYALYDEHATHQEEGPAISGWFDFARAVERAHGIGGQE